MIPTLALVLLAAPAADTARIQAQLDTASRLFESGLYTDALGVLHAVEQQLGADGEAEFPLLRFMMARCLIELGRTDEALGALDRFEALAQTDAERARAADWRARIEREQLGAVQVDCPAGATAHLGSAGEGVACPATLERVPIGPATIVVRGAGPERIAEVEVVAGETTPVTPTAPPPPTRWWHAGLSVGGGGGWLLGAFPAFVEPDTGSTLRASAFGELRVWRMLWLGVGVGFAHESQPFEDTDARLEGKWTRQIIDVPIHARAALPWWGLGVVLGGAVEVPIEAREHLTETDPLREAPVTDTESAVDDLFEDLTGRLTIGIDRTFDLGVLDLRAAVRHHHGLTPWMTVGDARRVGVEVALDVVF